MTLLFLSVVAVVRNLASDISPVVVKVPVMESNVSADERTPLPSVPPAASAAEPARAFDGAIAAANKTTAARRKPIFRCRSEEHTSELQSHLNLVCRLLLEKKNTYRASNIQCSNSDVPAPCSN